MMPRAKLDDNERKRRGEQPHNPEADGETAPSPEAEIWERPIPFGSGDVPVFPTASLPSPLRQFVEALAEATQVPADMPAALGLAVVAACVQRRIAVDVKPGYAEPTALFVAAVAEPGTRKSAVLGALTAPIEEWERGEAARLAPVVEKARTERAIKEKRKARLEDEAAKAKDHGEAADKGGQAAKMANELAAQAEQLAYPRVLADDVTPEQLARLMAEHGERLAVFSAEGGIFETMAGRYSQGVPNLDVFLKGHAGDWLRVDRRVGVPVVMEKPALTLALAVQPDVLRAIVNKPGFRGRGLLARFLYALPPNLLGQRRPSPAVVPECVRADYRDCILRLLALKPEFDGSPVRLSLSAEAAKAWLAFSIRLEPRLGPGGDLRHLADWAAKAAGAAVRIAGLMHAARAAGEGSPIVGAIEGDTMVAAVLVVETYFIPHAVAAFVEMGVDPEAAAAQAVIDWLQARGTAVISVRDAHDNLRRQVRFTRVDAVERALALAEQHGYVRRLPDPVKAGPGRPPSPRYAVNPMGKARPQKPHNPRNGVEGEDCADIADFAQLGGDLGGGRP